MSPVSQVFHTVESMRLLFNSKCIKTPGPAFYSKWVLRQVKLGEINLSSTTSQPNITPKKGLASLYAIHPPVARIEPHPGD